MELQQQKNRAAEWFTTLQMQLIQALEKVEHEYCLQKGLPASSFQFRKWHRKADDTTALPTSRFAEENEGGGGNSALLQGELFEKAGVNFSEVFGSFNPAFAAQIPGAQEDPRFWASGVSLVVHPKSPFLPTVHLNTRFIVTTKSWFGGGADLTPTFPFDDDTRDFHQAYKECCDLFDPTYYPQFKEEADRYFFLPHRNEPRGVGGIFYDYLNTGDWEKDFAFSQNVGLTFNKIYPEIIRRHMWKTWTEEDRKTQLIKRGRYVEFNLVYDRGTLFGLKTGGHTESILMSLPPLAAWV